MFTHQFHDKLFELLGVQGDIGVPGTPGEFGFGFVSVHVCKFVFYSFVIGDKGSLGEKGDRGMPGTIYA